MPPKPQTTAQTGQQPQPVTKAPPKQEEMREDDDADMENSNEHVELTEEERKEHEKRLKDVVNPYLRLHVSRNI